MWRLFSTLPLNSNYLREFDIFGCYELVATVMLNSSYSLTVYHLNSSLRGCLFASTSKTHFLTLSYFLDILTLTEVRINVYTNLNLLAALQVSSRYRSCVNCVNWVLLQYRDDLILTINLI